MSQYTVHLGFSSLTQSGRNVDVQFEGRKREVELIAPKDAEFIYMFALLPQEQKNLIKHTHRF